MTFKFENLEVWKLSMEYIDDVYRITGKLPRDEENNLRSQWMRAATSIALNIAEGSTGQTDSEQIRFLGYALRSLVESMACFRLAQRRRYVTDREQQARMEKSTETLIKKLQSFRKAIRMKTKGTRE
jgi:four helix bundle protein